MRNSHDLFVYGTLMVPEVMYAVTGRNFDPVPATLSGYRRCGIRGEVYPAIDESPEQNVAGLLYRGLDDRLLKLVDKFESSIYRRCRVQVESPGQLILQAWVYVISPGHRFLLSGRGWDLDRFRDRDLAAYLGGIMATAGVRSNRP